MSLLSKDQKNLIDKALQLHKDGKIQEAISFYLKIIEDDKNNPQLLFLLGTALVQIKDLKKGIEYLKKSIFLKPNNASAFSNLGNAFKELNHLDQALENYDKAIEINPKFADAYSNRGIILQEMRRFQEALESYNKAIEIKPDHSFAYNNRGIVLKDLNRLDEALSSYNKAIQINPMFIEPYNNMGNIFKDSKQYEEALKNFQKIMNLNRGYNYNLGKILHTSMFLSEWKNFDILYDQINIGINKKENVIEPFSFLGISDDPFSAKIVTELFIKNKFPDSYKLNDKVQNYDHKKPRVAYLSGDFYDHPVLHLMMDVFKNHDKSKFDIFGFSFGPTKDDKWRNEVKKYFSHFEIINDISDQKAANLIKEKEIDIIIDLSGLTGNSRVGILSYQACPIQINYLGFPGTMGAKFINYLIADEVVIPKENLKYYSEKVVYLPNCYQANMKQRKISDRALERKDFGLPDNGVVFCSFNNNYKITPYIFDSWMKILNEVENSVLWILKSNDKAVRNLKEEAKKRGVNDNRIIIASFMPNDEHLKRITLADIFLDTFPYNAHTTASDAVRMGVPIITLTGNSFHSRVGASILKTINMEDLITYKKKDYEDLAIELGSKPEKLTKYKNQLREAVVKSTLFDSVLFTKNLEELYLKLLNN